MVRMIPDTVSSSIKSNAEKKLFEQFKSYVTEKNIIVLHSLGIAEHVDHIFGEIDFVVICEQGFLCIEVKGGVVSRNNGIWNFTNRYGETTQKREGPFTQAQGNMHSLRKYINDRFGSSHKFARAQFACCVIMPDCSCNDNNDPDFANEILFDQSKTWDLGCIINRSFSYWNTKIQLKHNFKIEKMSPKSINEAAIALRGDVRFVPLMGETVEDTFRKLTAITKAQYNVMMSTSRNPRHMIEGKAGTGKTLIAMEQCRRASIEGKKVLYLCYNKNIAHFVDAQFSRDDAYIKSSTLHSLMSKECGHSPYGYHSPSYFTHDLPTCFLDDTINPEKYDLVVIDEGQDLLNSIYLRCIDKLIKGGLNKGRWAIYYDPNQNIYSGCTPKAIDYLNNISSIFTLYQNCRNTNEIIHLNKYTSNISQADVLDTVHGPRIQVEAYKSKDEEYDKISKLLIRLKEEYVKAEDIVILSAYSQGNIKCFVHDHPLPSSVGNVSYDKMSWYKQSGVIRFSSVASFKGLESKVIIFADVDAFEDDARRLLNYVAISRAQTMIYMFYDNYKESEREKMIKNGILMD